MRSLLTRSAALSHRRHVNAHVSRSIVTLAIETSCDDTSVAVAELLSPQLHGRLKVHFHEKVTADNDAYNGIHPLVALHSHRRNLALLVQKALQVSPKPDFVSVTRGPGMRSNLSTGLDTAKGLAVAWDVPLLATHHMQAHALTPRLVAAMEMDLGQPKPLNPAFPFLTLLASGGHTMLINSTGLVEHSILADTQDIAIGDCLDKAARAILPAGRLAIPYGRALEEFAFPNGPSDYQYTAPTRRREELERRPTKWRWGLFPPLSESKRGEKSSKRMVYSFTGLTTSIERITTRVVDAEGRLTSVSRRPEDISEDERRELAREVQRIAFEHLASRIILHLSSNATDVNAIVVSGGVASNSFLRHLLRAMLDARGYDRIRLEFPPISLCTDNALMIAWAALEMWHAGYRSSLDVQPLRKWSMDPNAEDGGILGVGGWHNVLKAQDVLGTTDNPKTP
ncbi:unnamed protein product [Zymoseptoria tritici ST99CH_1A5]|uniref:N(6)-L-threonylcarbamoyladenine synthase n=1 Tax=Zymoseptoria tritici ST99CH_1A5 TaxID=1276529 RepID=A0A1Y6L8V1_ZYMTR|nr:unnamed protein product [Zymoseptoria tritici ST99CH_1A5]